MQYLSFLLFIFILISFSPNNGLAYTLRWKFYSNLPLSKFISGKKLIDKTAIDGKLSVFCKEKGFDHYDNPGKDARGFYIYCIGNSEKIKDLSTYIFKYNTRNSNFSQQSTSSAPTSLLYSNHSSITNKKALAKRLITAYKDTKHLQKMIFKKQNLEEISYLSKLKYEHFPIVKINDFSFRINYSKNFEENLLQSVVSNLSAQPNDGYLYLFKSIRNSQLCLIQKDGIDAKFGGIGGASEDPRWRHLKKNDKGKNFFSLPGDLSSFITEILENKSKGYDSYYYHHFLSPAELLLIKIPLDQTLNLNLTYSFSDWFIAGTVIPPEYIYVYYKDQPLKKFPITRVSTAHKSDLEIGKYSFIKLNSINCDNLYENLPNEESNKDETNKNETNKDESKKSINNTEGP